jgi:VWFA-related protein
MRPLLVVSLVIGLAAAGSAQQRPIFRSDVNVVTVDVYPLRDGRVVNDLVRDDFTLLEDGKPQTIETFEFVSATERMTSAERRDPRNQGEMLEQLRDPKARAFVAFLDVAHAGISGAYYARQPLVELFQRILAPADLIALTTSRANPRDMTFGRTTEVVEQQLTKWWTWLGATVRVEDAEDAALELCFPGEKSLVAELIARRRQDELLSTLEGTIEYLGEVREGRKTLFLFSRGWQWFAPKRDLLKVLERQGYSPSQGPPVGPTPRNRPPVGNEPAGNLGIRSSLYEGERSSCETELMRLSNLDSAPRFRRLVQAAAMNNVVVYPVDVAGLVAQSGPRETGPGSDRLLEFARNTGGTAVTNRNDLVQGVIDVSREFSGYYLLTYTPQNRKADGTFRRIEVKVDQPDLDVRARGGYRAPTLAESSARSAASAPPLGDKTSPAHAEALASLSRLRPDAPVRMRAVRDKGQLLVDLQVVPAVSSSATVSVTVSSAAGDIVGAGRGTLASGESSTTVPLDVVSGVGSLRVTARVEPDGGDTMTGTALVTDADDVRILRGRSAVRMTPSGDVQFSRAERLVIAWSGRQAGTVVSARVLDRSGRPTQVTVDSRAAVAADLWEGELSLSPLAQGDYVIELSATGADGRMTDRRLLAIRVTR